MIVLSEYNPKAPKNAGVAYLKRLEEAARMQGLQVVNFDRNKSLESLENHFYRKNHTTPKYAFWLGFVPSFEHYQSVYTLLKNYNIHLLNSPEAFANSEYFDRFYPSIKDLTFQSYIAKSEEEAIRLVQYLDYPIFIKGAIQSLKKWGWNNCIAHSERELKSIIQQLYAKPDFALDTIILRAYHPLEASSLDELGTPKAHEYRFMLYNNEIIDYSFYWNGANPYTISTHEVSLIKSLAVQAAKNVASPFVSVDIAKTQTGQWYVIELGDGQFSDIRQISPLKFWNFFRNIELV